MFIFIRYIITIFFFILAFSVASAEQNLKFLNIGIPDKPTNLEISFASKKAIEVLEKNGEIWFSPLNRWFGLCNK